MDTTYICNDCGYGMTTAEYQERDELFCPECGGYIEEFEEPKPVTSPSPRPIKKTLLVTCEACKHEFSKRATKCPRCEWVPTASCSICKNKIPLNSKFCPECGDPCPFSVQENTQPMDTGGTTLITTLDSFERLEGYTINNKLICPHCSTSGGVVTKKRKARKGISGIKVLGALATLGLSANFTGIDRKEWVTDAKCKNCGSIWYF